VKDIPHRSSERIQLSESFQTVLAMLVTNDVAARRYIAGELDASHFGIALTETETCALTGLLSGQGARLLTIAELRTGRRKHKVMALLPMTVRILGPRLHDYWMAYLDTTTGSGAPSPAAEANAFAAWTIEHLEHSAVESEMVRYELYRNDVLSRLESRIEEGSEEAVLALEVCRALRLADCVRVERFDGVIAKALKRFRDTGEVMPRTEVPIWLVFHPAHRLTVPAVAVTAVAEAVMLLLERARSAVDVGEFRHLVPLALAPDLDKAIERLVASGILQPLP
jgi:hypothetical protein